MDLSAIGRLLWRRWRVVIPTAVIVGVLLSLTLISQPPTYRASGTVLLLAPPQPPDTSGPSSSNPYARYNDISVVADILSRVVSSEETSQSLRAEGLQGTYVAAANTDFLRGPIIQVTAEADSAAGAIADVELVVDRLDHQLVALQKAQGTARRYFFTSEVIVPVTHATVVFSSVLRRLVVAAVLGFGILVGVALLADVLDRTLRNRAKRSASSTVKAPSGTD